MSFQRKVLVATDASKYASEIINTVAAANWRDGSELHLLTVVHKTPNWESQEEYMRQCSLIQKDHLSLLQAALPKCIDGVPAELIIKRAIDENFDLIILGSHGDTGVRPEHVGSIAAAVVNRAPCSVAVVKVGKAELKAAEMLTKAAAGKRN
jgi:nucleotide-binding universal stress UspA family protein